MARKVRGATTAPHLEALETRTMLSADAASTVLARFTAGTSAGQVQAEIGAVGGHATVSYPNGPTVISLAAGVNTSTAIAVLKTYSNVVYAEADATIHAMAITTADVTGPGQGSAYFPPISMFSQETGMIQVDAPYAWGITAGSSSTIVAVLDTGIDLKNQDFTGRIWTNPTANTDGLVGDVHGWNFVNNTGNVQDNNDHGTHVSGILAASGYGGYGIVGVDWNTQIMPVKMLDSQGNGTTDAAVAAVYFAVNHGAKVINASWGGDAFSQSMLDALNYADAHGVVFVTAAGNETSDNDNVTTYPASYRTPNELVVAAVDGSGNLASFSNWGVNTVDLAAPGVNIISTIPGGFASYSGTSMATPFVTGTIALLEGLHPELSAEQLVALVKATVKPDAALNGLTNSPGIVDPFYALINHQTIGSVTSSNTPPPPAPTLPQLIMGASSFEDVETNILANEAVYELVGGNNSLYVDEVYHAIDGRDPNPDELSYQVNALQSGAVDRAGLVLKLQGGVEAGLTKVARWFDDELGRNESIDALKYDPGVIATAGLLTAGYSDAFVQAAIFGNDLYYAGTGGTPSSYVAALYQAILGRPADADGLAYYTAELNNGATRESVALQFLGSPEGHLAAIARLYQDELGSLYPIALLETDPGVSLWAGYLKSS